MVRILAIILIVLALAAGLWWVVNKPRAIHLPPETETIAPTGDAPADAATAPDDTAQDETAPGETAPEETETSAQTAQPESAEPEAGASTQPDTSDDPLTLAGFDAAAITRLVDESDISAAQKTSLKALIAEAENDPTLREAVLEQVRAALQ